MKVNILYKPSYPMADVHLDENERITVEAGSWLPCPETYS